MSGFPAGLVLGLLIGVALGPVVRAWLLWQEIESSRRGSQRTDELLDSLDEYLSDGRRANAR